MSGSVQRLRDVEAAIERAARGAERDVSGIALIAVTKTVAADRIRPVLEAGHRAFGENYVQEICDQMAGSQGGVPQCHAPYDRAAPVQQGA